MATTAVVLTSISFIGSFVDIAILSHAADLCRTYDVTEHPICKFIAAALAWCVIALFFRLCFVVLAGRLCGGCCDAQEPVTALQQRNGGSNGLPPHAVVMAQPYAGEWRQGYAPGHQVMPAAAYGGPPGGGHGPVPVYTATMQPRGPPTVFQQPGGGMAMATLSTDQIERSMQPQAQPYGTEPPGSVYYAPPPGKAQGG